MDYTRGQKVFFYSVGFAFFNFFLSHYAYSLPAIPFLYELVNNDYAHVIAISYGLQFFIALNSALGSIVVLWRYGILKKPSKKIVNLFISWAFVVWCFYSFLFGFMRWDIHVLDTGILFLVVYFALLFLLCMMIAQLLYLIPALPPEYKASLFKKGIALMLTWLSTGLLLVLIATEVVFLSGAGFLYENIVNDTLLYTNVFVTLLFTGSSVGIIITELYGMWRARWKIFMFLCVFSVLWQYVLWHNSFGFSTFLHKQYSLFALGWMVIIMLFVMATAGKQPKNTHA